ncbi:MAG TPA: LysE family translocator [Candidatus Paceibacterota bacterium]|nr:LysE family translocator [Verrucomicrobiota bacterium]HRY47048.1 LysE family translocator [Candidatus Paceibacterota bacterium]
MTELQEMVVSATLLGLSAGLSPGPLMALVLSQTLRHGTREGCKTALAPLITDAPIILCALLLATSLAHFKTLLGVLSLAGGAYVLYLAWDSLKARPLDLTSAGNSTPPLSWRKGILTNLLSPSPWLFWFTVGAATLTKAQSSGWIVVCCFFAIFYSFLCGSKTVLALLAGRSRTFLSGRNYSLILQGLGFCLIAFALLLFRDGLRYFGSMEQ